MEHEMQNIGISLQLLLSASVISVQSRAVLGKPTCDMIKKNVMNRITVLKKKKRIVKFDIITAVTMKTSVFWICDAMKFRESPMFQGNLSHLSS
jgi:hypothetical protein